MTNSEARKRMQARSGPESPLSRPQTANLGDGANGRLSEAERVDLAEALHDALCDCRESGTGFTLRMADATKAIDRIQPLLANFVREHTERALAEVEQRIESRRSQPDHFGRASRIPFGAGLTEAIKIIRAARGEQS